MTITTTDRIAGPFQGDSSTRSFPFNFKVLAPEDLLVLVTRADGTEDTLVYGADYDVTLHVDQENNPGGTITYPRATSLPALHVDERLTISTDAPPIQPAELNNMGGFFPKTIEQRLDYLTILVQQLEQRLQRTLALGSITDPFPVPDLGSAEERANKFFYFDADGVPRLAMPLPEGSLTLENLRPLVEQLAHTIVPPFIPESRKMELIAHRGFRMQATQNTLFAYHQALRDGADALEGDIQVSSDGVLYLFHDTTVNALTDGSGTFTELPSSTIDTLKFSHNSGTPFEEIRIPRFGDFLDFGKRAGVPLHMEIKAYRQQSDIDLIIDAIEARDMEEQCILVSFDFSDIEYVRSRTDAIAVGFIGSSQSATVYEAAVDDLVALGGETYLVWSYAALLAQPAIVSYARNRGVDLSAWTVNTQHDAEALLSLGVTKIMSDFSLWKGYEQ